jgi:O-antigen ligase
MILHKKIYYLLLVCLVFTLPFSFVGVQISNILIVLLALSSIVWCAFSAKNENVKPSGMMLLFISGFFIHIIGLLWTDNWHEAFFELEKKVSLLIFPIVIFYSPRLNSKEATLVFFSFAMSCLVAALACFIVATYNYLYNGDSSLFFYHELSGIVGMDAAYLSMYFCFAIAILFKLRWSEFNHIVIFNSVLYSSAIILLFVSVFFLASRAQILILMTGMVGVLVFVVKRKYGTILSILGAIAVSIILIGIAALVPINRERFKEAFNLGEEFDTGKRWGEQQMRLLIWDCSFKLIKAHPANGVGTGDTQDELQECYIENKYTSLTYFDIRFNAHNQFLETAIGLGIMGFLVLLANFYFTFVYALKNKKVLYMIFVLIFAISCLTESLLERRSGIVFFAFFNSFFFFHWTKDGEIVPTN